MNGTDRIPTSRLVAVELRKMFDTRSGFWLLASIAILALVAGTAVGALAGPGDLRASTFAIAIGYPTSLVLPVVAILAVTAEWSGRTGLTTFTLVPHRSRVIAAKATACGAVAVATVPLTVVIAVTGTAVTAAVTGAEPVWDLTVGTVLVMGLANVLALLIGFTVGVVLRNSVAAIAVYAAHAFVLPALFVLLGRSQPWFAGLQPWVDVRAALGTLVDGTLTAAQWSHLGVSAALWLVLPLAVGLAVIGRSEVR